MGDLVWKCLWCKIKDVLAYQLYRLQAYWALFNILQTTRPNRKRR